MTDATLRERPDAGNPHVRIGEGNVAPAAVPRRGVLLSKAGCVLVAACAAVLEALAAGGRLPPLVGDGVADDTAAIQARLDSGAPCVYLPPPKHENGFFFGMAMRFSHVEGMTVRGLTIRNPTSYGLAFCRTSYFLVDDLTFDYTTCNPIFLNMDGVHLDGWCHHGKISNLRGTCFDDMVALNANDGQCAQEEGDITDIDIDGIYADYCHSAVRLLSTGANLKRVTIRNVHGNFYTYMVGLTHFFGNRKTRGVFDDIVIRDAFAAKALSPENVGVHSRAHLPLVWVEGAVDVGRLTVEGLSRDEKTVPVATLRIDEPATVRTLTVRDCKMTNALETPVPFMEVAPIPFMVVRGNVGKATVENIDFTGRWTQTGRPE